MLPEMVYKTMVSDNRAVDTYEQLKRRITSITYHYRGIKTQDFRKIEVSISEYTSYAD